MAENRRLYFSEWERLKDGESEGGWEMLEYVGGGLESHLIFTEGKKIDGSDEELAEYVVSLEEFKTFVMEHGLRRK